MSDKIQRPIYLDLSEIKLPKAAIMSIMHRISGVLMVLLFPIVLFILQLSLSGEEGFQRVEAFFDSSLVRLLVFFLCWALVHHFMAGIRFLLIDLKIGLYRPAYGFNARVVLYSAPIIAFVLSWGLLS